METIGVREMRANTAEIIRKAETGHHYLVTVQGRPVAEIGPVTRPRWTTWDQIGDLFESPGDPTLMDDLGLLGPTTLTDPWSDTA